MGRDKALLPWPPQPTSSTTSSALADTFLSAAIRLFFSHVDVVLVVAGKNEAALAPIVYANGASLVVNPEPERGQFSSLRVGLQEVLSRGRDAAMITLVDRPPLQPATLATLESAFERAATHRKWAVIPEYQGKHGHPILAGREMIEAFLRRSRNLECARRRARAPERDRVRSNGRPAGSRQHRYARAVCVFEFEFAATASAVELISPEGPIFIFIDQYLSNDVYRTMFIEQ